MRPPFGFDIRALAGGDLTLTQLGARLGVTKQAAIKVVDEIERDLRRDLGDADVDAARRALLLAQGNGSLDDLRARPRPAGLVRSPAGRRPPADGRAGSPFYKAV
jgi:hypothetical protein